MRKQQLISKINLNYKNGWLVSEALKQTTTATLYFLFLILENMGLDVQFE